LVINRVRVLGSCTPPPNFSGSTPRAPTVICQENGAFLKHSSNWRKMKMPAMCFSVEGKHFENGAL